MTIAKVIIKSKYTLYLRVENISIGDNVTNLTVTIQSRLSLMVLMLEEQGYF